MDDWGFLTETLRASWQEAGRPDRVIAAVSGGADSVALLTALHELALMAGFSLFAAHVNHGLRDNAEGDEAFVKALCTERSIPLFTSRLRLQAASENAAREARYAALGEACAQFNARVLALAHHQRDQAETVLLHLFRGSGTVGLAGMERLTERRFPSNGFTLSLWRPFLSVPPDRIRSALTYRGISWREDETNAGSAYLRNYLRHQVLPIVTARIPKAEEAICRAAHALSDESGYFRKEALRYLETEAHASRSGPCRWLRLAPLQALHPALRRHVLRLFSPVPLEFAATERLMNAAPGDAVNLPEDWHAVCSQGYMHFLPPEGTEENPPCNKTDLILLPWNGETGDGKRLQAIPEAIFAQCTLRFQQPGDRIHPLGAPGSKSMQDYWVDKKVPQPFRRYMPLLCVGNRVVWAIGAGVGEEARVGAGSRAILLRYAGYLPDYE